MAIKKVDNVWAAGLQPPPSLTEVLIGTQPPRTPPQPPSDDAAVYPPEEEERMPEIEEKSAPEGAPESETDSERTDTIGEEPRYIITEKMDTIADAARAASMRSIHAIDAAREADLNAREVATITQQSVEEANHSIEETNTFIAATNHAAELALNAAIAARDASHQATEFRRQGRVDIKEMESAIEASGSNLQNQKSRELFERTQALKQQTILLRKQLNNL